MSANALEELADRAAITDLIYRYCRAVDRLDRELGYSVWHEDGEAEVDGFYKGPGRGFIDAICENHIKTLAHSHQVSNIVLTLHGDRAASESYVTATIRVEMNGQIKHLITWARYVDRWSRRNGRWGIDKRVSIRDFDAIQDVAAINDLKIGRRDKDDPSYAVLGNV